MAQLGFFDADRRLSALSALFHTETRPNHRALADAKATVEVLHGLPGEELVLAIGGEPRLAFLM